MLPKISAKAVQKLSDNVITVPKAVAGTANPFLSIDGRKFNLFRTGHGRDGTEQVYISALPSQLKGDDIAAINSLCDANEGGLNRLVKQDLGIALSRYFNRESFHVNEAGCGRYPITSYFPANADITYHGIDTDPANVAALHKMKISASDWGGLPALPEGKTSVGVAVYALHFMVSRDVPRQIGSLFSDGGFFAGNFYIDPAERQHRKQGDFLARVLKSANMPFLRLKDPEHNANEYWVIGKASDVGPLHDFATILHDAMLMNRRSPPHPIRSL